MSRLFAFLKNLPVAVNLGIGFAIVLVLTFGVSVAGIGTIVRMQAGQTAANELDAILESMNEARLHEKDFIAHDDDAAANEADSRIRALVTRAESAQGLDAQHRNHVITLASTHGRAFADYRAAAKRGRDAEQGMVAAARAVEKAAGEVRAVELAEYEQKVANADSAASVKANVESALQIDAVVEAMLQARRHEKNFQIRGDAKYVEMTSQSVDRAEALAKGIGERARSDAARRAVGAVLVALPEYRKSFRQFVTSLEARNTLEKQLAESAVALDRYADETAGARATQIGTVCQAAKGVIGVGTIVALLLGVVAAAFTNRLIVPGLARAAQIADRVADGDLTEQIEVHRKDEIGRVLGALAKMNRKLSDVVGHVRSASGTLTVESDEIARGAEDLSERTKQQVGNLEETSASMQELTATVKQNAQGAVAAGQLAEAARQEAANGAAVLSRTVAAMNGIRAASDKITDIIDVMDEIAFQTNMLALNAAIEAACAGDEGRGFAVVAAEVHRLAQRSSEAAKQIASLIHDNVARVEEGSALVSTSGKLLADIQAAVEKLGATIQAISAASEEQSNGIEQVSLALAGIDAVTQQNAALVERTAAAASALDEESRALRDLIAYFNVEREAPTKVGEAPERRTHAPPAIGAPLSHAMA